MATSRTHHRDAARPVAFVDVDDTLVRSSGSKRIPMSRVVTRVRELSRSGVDVYCWSSGGAAYAEQSAIELGIADCFRAFLGKPSLMIDDQHPNDWKGLVYLHPNDVASMDADEIVARLRFAGSMRN